MAEEMNYAEIFSLLLPVEPQLVAAQLPDEKLLLSVLGTALSEPLQLLPLRLLLLDFAMCISPLGIMSIAVTAITHIH
jgi:hypothetical protein